MGYLFALSLGNLVPLTRAKNSAASNYNFEKKKASYFTGRSGVSSYVLTSQVLRETLWTPDIVDNRQKMLLNVCKQNWNLN
ncbi:HNH endonuclease family protein [Aeromonas caviae]